MKTVFLILVLTGWTVSATAQAQTQARVQTPGISGVSRQLALVDPVSGANVEVRVTGAAAGAVGAAESISGPASVTLYGVRLFSDSSQDGRANARAALDRFAEIYPDTVVDMVYESPWFRVTAGDFVDRIDAVALCGRVLVLFPLAFVVQHEVPIADIVIGKKSEQVLENRL